MAEEKVKSKLENSAKKLGYCHSNYFDNNNYYSYEYKRLLKVERYLRSGEKSNLADKNLGRIVVHLCLDQK